MGGTPRWPAPGESPGGRPDPALCSSVDADLAELALGVLEGQRRAELLDHLDRCDRCAASLGRHTVAVDGLLGAAPVVEPPVGFEERLARRIGTEPRPRALSWSRRHLVAAGVALAVAAASGAAVALAVQGSPAAPGGRPVVAALNGGGAWRGDVVVTSGRPSWMSVVIDDETWSGWVSCDLTTTGGGVVDVGRFDLTAGYGAWTLPLAVAPTSLRTARIVADDGRLVAEADLRA